MQYVYIYSAGMQAAQVHIHVLRRYICGSAYTSMYRCGPAGCVAIPSWLSGGSSEASPDGPVEVGPRCKVGQGQRQLVTGVHLCMDDSARINVS
jgi:hypothetical protein